MASQERQRDWQGEVLREMGGGQPLDVGEESGGSDGAEASAAAASRPDSRRPPAPPPRPQHQPQPQPQPEPQQRVSWSEPRPEWPPPATAPRPGPPPAAAPDTAQTMAPGEENALGRIRHGDPLGQRALHAARRVLGPASHDTESLAQVARRIQQPINTGRQIAVTSIRGGAGKSTVAALLALTFAHYRTDPVLALEADAPLGTLPRRLGAREVRWSCVEVARIIDPSMRITDVTGYLVPFSGGWLLPGSRGAGGGPLDMQSYWSASTTLRRFFATTVVDCGALPGDVARQAVNTTQARVLVAPATPEGVTTTRWVLDWVGSLGGDKLAATVVALTHPSPDMALDERWAAARLEVGGARVVSLPYDRSLAAGGEIRTSMLGRGVREAAALLAAEAMDRAVRG